MKKASATVIYKAEPRILPDNTSTTIYIILNLTVNYKGDFITLIHPDEPAPYKHTTFNSMYEDVLGVAKNNGFYFSSYKEFGVDWFDVQWISTDGPGHIRKYGYKKGVRV